VATRSIATGGPERLDFVLAERQRRPLGTADVLAVDDTTLGTPTAPRAQRAQPGFLARRLGQAG